MFAVGRRAVVTFVRTVAVGTGSVGAALWGRRYAVLGQALGEGVAAWWRSSFS